MKTTGSISPDAAGSPAYAPRADDPAVDERLFIASLEKGLRVLEILGEDEGALSLGEIAERTGYGKSAVQRLVHTLSHLGYIRKDASGRRFRLTSKLFLIASRQTSTAVLAKQAYPYLADLNTRTGETSVLSIPDGSKIVVLAAIPGRHINALNVQAGMRFPLVDSSSGLVMLATWSDDEASRLAPQTPARLSAFQKALESARSSGFCITEGSIVAGQVSISAPIVDADGRALAAVNISTLTARFSPARARKELAPLIVAAARSISAELGAH